MAKREGDARRAVYQISTRGGEARKVFEAESDVIGFSFSPDRQRLAFLTRDERSEAKKRAETKGFNQEIYEENLLYTRLRLTDLRTGDGPASRSSTNVEVEGSLQWVKFSPDGQRLLVSVTATPLVDDTYVSQRLRVLSLDGKTTVRLENPGKVGQADWSPDSRH